MQFDKSFNSTLYREMTCKCFNNRAIFLVFSELVLEIMTVYIMEIAHEYASGSYLKAVLATLALLAQN